MKCIAKNCDDNVSGSIIAEAEAKCNIVIREDIKEFLRKNSGGYPIKDIISDGEKYEVRSFLSLAASNKYFSIEKPLWYFLKKTAGKIIPIGIDSGDNYYCVNNETGKVYYWNASEDAYFCIANSLNDFVLLFE